MEETGTLGNFADVTGVLHVQREAAQRPLDEFIAHPCFQQRASPHDSCSRRVRHCPQTAVGDQVKAGISIRPHLRAPPESLIFEELGHVSSRFRAEFTSPTIFSHLSEIYTDLNFFFFTKALSSPI